MIYKLSLPCLLACSILSVNAQQVSENIRLNQIGFYPNAPKIAVVAGDAGSLFYIRDAQNQKIVFTGTLGPTRTNPFSQKITHVADFSAFQTPGIYLIDLPQTGSSYPFSIQKNVHRNVAIGSLRGFYYQRASTALPEKYAGAWHRTAGHPDIRVVVHPSAASAARPAGTIIAAPQGWYDAGDYNKYVVNSGISMGTLLSLFEDFPAYCKALNTNIPESGNAMPDVLDEVLWNLRWMLAMQDPSDGGVYHKLTNPRFDGMVMPNKATETRYVVQKNTIATLDFAAVTAQASRIFRMYDKNLADSCLLAAEKAWKWALANPAVAYDQNAMNKTFDPDVVTGGYEDGDNRDEWIWAATELYITTKKDAYYQAVPLYPDALVPLPSWSQVRSLAYYSLIRCEKDLTKRGKNDLPALKKRVLAMADALIKGTATQPYNTVMGKTAGDYSWGSSANAANQGIALLQAYHIQNKQQYLRFALGNLDYLLGRNATGYSFLTGFGHKTPMHPHHRPSEADGIGEPVPGLLSGGPNPAQQDHCTTYPNKLPDESFTDDVCSYASNEIAINWNAPMVYLAAAIEALQEKLHP